MKTIEHKDESDRVTAILNITDSAEHYCNFALERVVAWDENDSPVDLEHVCHGTIKWDGCSHIYFTGEDAGSTGSYYHLCGIEAWKFHCDILKWLYQTVTSEIASMDAEELWL